MVKSKLARSSLIARLLEAEDFSIEFWVGKFLAEGILFMGYGFLSLVLLSGDCFSRALELFFTLVELLPSYFCTFLRNFEGLEFS